MKKISIYLIFILGLTLRLVSSNQSLWLDEATSVTVARDFSFSQILTQFSPGDFHPPGQYLLLKAWGMVFGYGELSMRLPSILAGLVTIYTLYLIGKSVANEKIGLLSALLLATSGLHIYYSQEARMYSLSAMFVALAVYFFVKIYSKSNKKYLTLLSLSLLGVGMFDYLPLIVVPVFWIYALVNKKGKDWWRSFLLAHVPLFAGVVLISPILILQLSSGFSVETTSPLWYDILGRTTFKQIALVPTKFMFGRISFDSKPLYGSLVVSAGLFFAYLLVSAWKSKKESFDWYWLVLPIFITGLVGFKIPAFSYFRLLFALPAFYLLVAKGALHLKPNVVSLVVFVILAINIFSSGYYLLTHRLHREDWRSMVGFVDGTSRGSAVTLFVANSQMEAYRYYQGATPAIAPAQLSDTYDTIWLMRYVQDVFDPTDKVRNLVEIMGYQKQSEHDFNGVVVWKYKK